MQALPNYQPTSVTSTQAVYSAKGLDTKTFTYDALPTQQSVYNTLISFKTKYPEGTPFTDIEGDVSYKSYTSTTIIPHVTYEGRGCVAFAFELSDAAFGDLPGRYSFDFDNVRVGDIIRLNDDGTGTKGHSFVVLEVNSDTITVCEGNYNSSVHWGRTISRSDALANWNYMITRYPN